MKIRLTQPICFNDPFETATIVKGGFGDRDMPYDYIKETYDRFQGSMDFTDEKDNQQLAKMERRQWSMNQVKKFVSNDMGVISLSSKFDNPLMWGHYALSSRWFVLGMLPLFSIRLRNTLVVCQAKEVSYQQTPPILDLAPYLEGDKFYIEQAVIKNFNQLFYTKSILWNYESEYRIVSSLPDEKPSQYDNGYPIHLVDVLPPQIQVIIAGAHSSNKLDNCLKSHARNLNLPFFKAFKAINAYAYGFWDEATHSRKVEAFGNKNNFGYNHADDNDR